MEKYVLFLVIIRILSLIFSYFAFIVITWTLIFVQNDNLLLLQFTNTMYMNKKNAFFLHASIIILNSLSLFVGIGKRGLNVCFAPPEVAPSWNELAVQPPSIASPRLLPPDTAWKRETLLFSISRGHVDVWRNLTKIDDNCGAQKKIPPLGRARIFECGGNWSPPLHSNPSPVLFRVYPNFLNFIREKNNIFLLSQLSNVS